MPPISNQVKQFWALQKELREAGGEDPEIKKQIETLWEKLGEIEQCWAHVYLRFSGAYLPPFTDQK